jgi:HlyD family secretion protein
MIPRRLFGYLSPILVLAVLIAVASYFLSPKEIPLGERFRFEHVDRGELLKVIQANGTLNPVSLIKVGTQVSGTIHSIHADFNDRVRAGQVLARLDPILLETAVANSQANLSQAEVSLELRRSQWRRCQQLVARQFLSPAQLEEAERAVQAAEAVHRQAAAQLRRDRANLNYSVIRSPVDGVVVARNVDVGQTVAAAFQTPTLFQIANDLRAMQIDTAISEADIGGIKAGMPVRFGVDAYTQREFNGKVKQLRLNPTTQQGVVTYNAVIEVDNADAALLPGMTAHITLTVGVRREVLRIPNAALRFQPGEDILRQFPANNNAIRVFRHRDGVLESVTVETGISDGMWTELVSGDLAIGDPLVVRDIAPNGRNGRPRLGMRLY